MKEFNLFRNWDWSPPATWLKIKTIDLHTGGEPLRVITHGLPDIQGNTILEKRSYFKNNLDHIRTGIMFEPRGHADMYGAIITPPVSADADFGTFFMHNEGYSTMCGHAIIALVKLVIDTGLIRKTEDNPELIIDAPPGKIIARAELRNNVVEKVFFRNVPSFVLHHKEDIYVEGPGKVVFDVSFGGAFYVVCDADTIELNLDEANYSKIIDYGRRIKKAVMNNYVINHPFENDLSFLYGTIFTSSKVMDKKNHSRNVCVFADGEVDRSSTGSGVSARAAIHHLNEELPPGKSITIESILGTTMDVKIIKKVKYGNHDAIVPEVSGTAHITGVNTFVFDPEDPLKGGFILR